MRESRRVITSSAPKFVDSICLMALPGVISISPAYITDLVFLSVPRRATSRPLPYIADLVFLVAPRVVVSSLDVADFVCLILTRRVTFKSSRQVVDSVVPCGVSFTSSPSIFLKAPRWVDNKSSPSVVYSVFSMAPCVVISASSPQDVDSIWLMAPCVVIFESSPQVVDSAFSMTSRVVNSTSSSSIYLKASRWVDNKSSPSFLVRYSRWHRVALLLRHHHRM